MEVEEYQYGHLSAVHMSAVHMKEGGMTEMTGALNHVRALCRATQNLVADWLRECFST